MNLPEKLECFEIKEEHLKILNFILEEPTFPWEYGKSIKLTILQLCNLLNKNPFPEDDPRHNDLSHFSHSLIEEIGFFYLDMKLVMEILRDNLSKGITCGIFIRSKETKNKWVQTTKEATYY